MVKEVIERFPKGVDEETFTKNFIKIHGFCLNHDKYGFPSLKDCLESLTGFINVSSRGQGNFYYPSASLNAENSKKPKASSCNSIPVVVVTNLDALMRNFPSGLNQSLLMKEYEKQYGERLEFQDFGFSNLTGLIKALPLVFKTDEKDSTLWHPRIRCSSSPKVLAEVNEGIRKVLKAEKGIMLSSDVGKFYKKHYGRPLDLFHLGVQNMDELLLRLSSSSKDQKNPFFEMQEIAGPHYLVRLLPRASSDLETPPPSQSSPLSHQSPSTSIKRRSVPSAAFSDFVPIFVYEFNGPYDFHIRLVDQEEDFCALMESLNSLCNSSHSSLKMVKEDIRPGNVVAALYDGVWHRGEILGVSSDSTQVQISYFDFGTIRSGVKIENLLRLGRNFLSLPRQAFKAQLAHLNPSSASNESLNADVKRKMRKDQDRVFLGKVISIDSEDVLHLELKEDSASSPPNAPTFNDLFLSRNSGDSKLSMGKSKNPLRTPKPQTLERVSSKKPVPIPSSGVVEIPLPNDRTLMYLIGLQHESLQEREPMVSSAGISGLFPKWKKKDLLRIMLDHKKIKFEFVTLHKENDPWIWEFVGSKRVPGFDENMVRLFYLRDVPSLIPLFTNEKDARILQVISEHIPYSK
eukprot:TRINITY_DN8159_c0_g1_i1.p1 TRINITY_DN8159_c0_g1~~TRINITY_DN8159_c0_g1_i1.p1  ORF type:complete len:631 (-),score=111.70 TRINITY_DN8159_c0_g1_i1:20-1912(-)